MIKRLKSSLLLIRTWALGPPIPTPIAWGPKNSPAGVVLETAPFPSPISTVIVLDGKFVDSKNLTPSNTNPEA